MENITEMLILAKQATQQISSLSAAKKQEVLEKLALVIELNAKDIIAENAKDLQKMSDDDPKKDRLLLNQDRIITLAQSVREVALLEDPTGKILLEKHLPNGLFIQKKTVALGVVGVIYEARPNVTIDVAALCIRSGNVCLLRGGSDAEATNIILVDKIRGLLASCNLDVNIVQLLPIDRKHVQELLQAEKYVDIIIPRGSQQLIDEVRKHSKVPVIETGAGVCHTYVAKSANLEDAAKIVCNAKVSRPSVCNALDTVIVDHEVLKDFLPLMADLLLDFKVEIFAEEPAFSLLKELNYHSSHK